MCVPGPSPRGGLVRVHVCALFLSSEGEFGPGRKRRGGGKVGRGREGGREGGNSKEG